MNFVWASCGMLRKIAALCAIATALAFATSTSAQQTDKKKKTRLTYTIIPEMRIKANFRGRPS